MTDPDGPGVALNGDYGGASCVYSLKQLINFFLKLIDLAECFVLIGFGSWPFGLGKFVGLLRQIPGFLEIDSKVIRQFYRSNRLFLDSRKPRGNILPVRPIYTD